ncbi:MAG TPA: hypothetical protein VNO30_35825 [Kofleriaceae bacterium]|nr:hypothetical protein [Kofleriaceae bacterium]
MEEKKTSEAKISTFAQRLKDKLSGSPETVPAEEIVTELLDSQLDAVTGGHVSGHLSIDTVG